MKRKKNQSANCKAIKFLRIWSGKMRDRFSKKKTFQKLNSKYIRQIEKIKKIHFKNFKMKQRKNKMNSKLLK